jgi:hypothetical protein
LVEFFSTIQQIAALEDFVSQYAQPVLGKDEQAIKKRLMEVFLSDGVLIRGEGKALGPGKQQGNQGYIVQNPQKRYPIRK